MTKLIVSEKNNVAKRIASILAGGNVKSEKSQGLSVYAFSENGDDVKCVGLRGHVLKVDFPTQYSDWQKVKPESLIDAQVIKVPIQKSIIKNLKEEAKGVDEVIIATDFDREGELIGADVLNLVQEVNPEVLVKRARFSALTKTEINNAFSNLQEVYKDLAQAGEARQDIDLVWGATLTRFLSLATTRLGNRFLSAGRVQSPTLALIVEREKERQAFTSKPYWQIKCLFESDGSQFSASHKEEKFWDEKQAKEIDAKLGNKGTVTEVRKTVKDLNPPVPFNTTSFLSSASQVGLSPVVAMRIAESLYNQGYISYPRVDNTVYPSSLNIRGILTELQKTELGNLAAEILKQESIIPTRGKKEATDHPPIHPTGAASKGQLNSREWKVYELVCRRFMATLSPKARMESVRVEIDVNGEPFLAKGNSLLKEGWLKFYHYNRKKDEEIPSLESGTVVSLVEKRLEEKETQPPARYSQGRIIRKMEQLGLGTKSTRHYIIQHLYDREYARDNPIAPTETGFKVAGALKKHAERISTPQMTAELEKAMDAIADGEMERDEVVRKSRQMLADVMISLNGKKKELAEEIREGIREDRIKNRLIGKCPDCGSDLKIVVAKKSKKRFVGCSGYPNCSRSYPLPQKGKIITQDKVCDTCGSPKVKVVSKGRKGKKYWDLCINPDCPSKKNNNSKKQAS